MSKNDQERNWKYKCLRSDWPLDQCHNTAFVSHVVNRQHWEPTGAHIRYTTAGVYAYSNERKGSCWDLDRLSWTASYSASLWLQNIVRSPEWWRLQMTWRLLGQPETQPEVPLREVMHLQRAVEYGWTLRDGGLSAKGRELKGQRAMLGVDWKTTWLLLFSLYLLICGESASTQSSLLSFFWQLHVAVSFSAL